MKEKISNEYYLESAPIPKAIMHLGVPMMIGVSVGTIYNVINAYFIGRLHNTYMLDAITLSLPVFIILMAVGNVFGTGAGTFISRLLGEKEGVKCKKVGSYAFYGSIVAAILLSVILIIFINPIVRVLGANAMTFSYTKAYVVTMLIGGFSIVLNFALEQLVRSEGATKESMYGIMISCAFNLILDPLFILVLRWDVKGAAIAMTLANLSSVAYYIYFLETKSENLKGFLKVATISFKDQLEIYKVGMSELIQCAFMITSVLLINNFAVHYGDNVIAGFGVALRLVQIPEFLTMGLYLGLIPLFAYSFSSNNIKRFKRSIKSAFFCIAAIVVIFSGGVFIFRNQVIHLFSSDPSVIKIGTYILTAMLVSTLFNGFTGLFIGVFQATGQGLPTMIMAITQGVLFIPIVIFLNYSFGLHGLIWSMTVTESITFLLGIGLFVLFNRKINKI